jgi:sialate O-acetylesterase
MGTRFASRMLAGLALAVGLASVATAEVKLPSLFAPHMVLQRDMPVAVWGWADAGEKVTVTLGEQTKTATADADGKWSLKLDALKAGGPLALRVAGKNVIEIDDVLVGEVWLCSGQSNMAMTVGSSNNADQEKAAANWPKIRMFTVERKTADQPREACQGDWKVCSPDTVLGFSAAGYFFGRKLHQELDVPVGLINSSWGGTPVQAWTSEAAHRAAPELAPLLENLEKAVAGWSADKAKENYEKQLAQWQEKVAAKAAGQQPPRKPNPSQDPNLSPNSPARLYNGMIAPLVPYALRGAIWYQGESNAGNAPIYGPQMRAMISSWRSDWKHDFAFISVQLPNFMAAQQKPSEMGGWPLIREQFVKLLEMPQVGMAITIDIGDADDIHPKNKQDVGSRLAMWALSKTYGKDIVASGPLYKGMKKDGEKIVVSFDYLGGGLVSKGEKLEGFAIAGADKQFVWADAKIEGDTVVVSSAEVKEPVAVRYAWANNPKCNLFSKAELPASPFRTDDWNE